MAITIHSPEGRTAVAPRSLASTPVTLAGRRVAVLDNGKPNAGLLLTTLADALNSRVGTRVSLVVGKETAATPADPTLLHEIGAAADLVLTGSADWGSCTSWSVHDLVELETAGVPTVVVATEPFAPLARQVAEHHRLADARIAVIAHPLGGTSEEDVRARAHAAVEQVLELLAP